MKTEHRAVGIAHILRAFLAFAASFGYSTSAGEAAGTVDQTRGQPLQVPLEWQEWAESSGPLDAYPLRFSPAIQPFRKEPDFNRHRVVRGAFGCGVWTNDFIPFAWDHSANRLYLDLNENRDLTDDSEAVYVGEYDNQFQLFPRVRLNIHTPSGSHRFLVDLRLGGATTAQLSGSYRLRSFWQARLELGGRAYQIGLVENPEAKTVMAEARHLLFRAWEARTEPIRLDPGTPHLIQWPKRVYLAGQGFALSSDYTNQADSPRYGLELTPAQPQLGELRANGQDLYRLILEQPGGYTAILDSPGQAEKIPAGTYQTAEVWLRHGTAEAFYIGPLSLTVGAEASVSLAIGGPLTNRVEVERNGENLLLRYRLAGADSLALAYRLSTEDRSHPPGWTIYSGDKLVASGKFEYG